MWDAISTAGHDLGVSLLPLQHDVARAVALDQLSSMYLVGLNPFKTEANTHVSRAPLTKSKDKRKHTARLC